MPPETLGLVEKVLASGMLTEGEVTRSLEAAVAEHLGVSRALAVTSCTTGLEAALRALGVGPGDEVIVPDYTYPATASVVRLVGADVVLVDVDPDTMLIDPAAMEAAIGPRTRAALPVSLFGLPLPLSLYETLRSRAVLCVEDAACSIGARVGGDAVGCLADVSVFSLHPRKILTTGEGGLVTARDTAVLERIDSYKHFGMQPGASPPRFDRIGTNLKLSNLLAAVGLAQMPHLPRLIAARRERASRYDELLRDVPGVARPRLAPQAEPTWQTYCVRVPGRDRILSELRGEGIEVQIGSYALHRQPAFAPGPGIRHASALAGSARLDDEALALPLHAELGADEQAEVAEAVVKRLPVGARKAGH